MSDQPVPTLGETLSGALRAGNVLDHNCPSRAVLRGLTGQWAVLVLIVLEEGTLRFAELRRRVSGVSDRMLAQTLQRLEADGMVDRRAYPVVPPHVEYALTPLGREAAVRVRELADWVAGNIAPILDAQRRYADMREPATA
ncbi:MAG: winged helix-turn-helix transcriptional regulator [Pseudomonadota bacterium]